MKTVRGAIVGGELREVDRRAVDAAVGSMPDGPVVLTIEDEKESRSSRANRMYWAAVVSPLCEKTGYTKEEMHDILRHKFNRRTAVDPQTGEVIEIDGGTRRMPPAEFTIYVDSCIRWANELGVFIQPYEE